ncbi:unnamed protein product [Mesocestoides corti]|uniref:Uncharacterized protein n=2 Tax=Mesocestoides corti TaxID=53468 RepID=A0A0R3U7M3_MESCO|nr:unnamed protein product [Mesocestoides corti]
MYVGVAAGHKQHAIPRVSRHISGPELHNMSSLRCIAQPRRQYESTNGICQMNGIGWNFSQDLQTPGLETAGTSQAYPRNDYAAFPGDAGATRGIGFVLPGDDEPLATAPPQPQAAVPGRGLFAPGETGASRSYSFNAPRRPPPPRPPNPKSTDSGAGPDADDDATTAGKCPTRSKSSVHTRPGTNAETYERGLADMADLMTTVELSEPEKRKLRERFSLDQQ